MQGLFVYVGQATSLCPLEKKWLCPTTNLSWGTDIFSARGIFIYSPWLCQACPPLHGDCLFEKPNVPVFTQVEDKKRPCKEASKSSCKVFLSMSGRLSDFALWRKNDCAPRHSTLDLVKPIVAISPSNCKNDKQNATPFCTFDNENKFHKQ